MVEMLKKNPNITKQEIETAMKISRAAITRNIAKLRELGILIRKGSNKTGQWQVKSNKHSEL